MKSSPIPTHHRPAQAVICAFGALLASCFLVSCAGSSSSAAGPSRVNPEHWHRVKNDPPTYYPKGVPADHPCEYSDGYWVKTGDAKGTRYFVPNKATNCKALIDEAMSDVSPQYRQAQNSKKDQRLTARDIAGGIGKGLFYTAAELDYANRLHGGDGLLAEPIRR